MFLFRCLLAIMCVCKCFDYCKTTVIERTSDSRFLQFSPRLEFTFINLFRTQEKTMYILTSDSASYAS